MRRPTGRVGFKSVRDGGLPTRGVPPRANVYNNCCWAVSKFESSVQSARGPRINEIIRLSRRNGGRVNNNIFWNKISIPGLNGTDFDIRSKTRNVRIGISGSCPPGFHGFIMRFLYLHFLKWKRGV